MPLCLARHTTLLLVYAPTITAIHLIATVINSPSREISKNR